MYAIRSYYAIARMNVPAIYVYAGTIKPGRWKGQDLTIVGTAGGIDTWSTKVSNIKVTGGRITSYNVCYTKLLRWRNDIDLRVTLLLYRIISRTSGYSAF